MVDKHLSPVNDEHLSPMTDATPVPVGAEDPNTVMDDPSAAVDENASPCSRGRPFEKGKSGNPAGRPKGSRNRTTLAMEALLDGQAEGIMKKLMDVALAGDLTALRMCVDRILPVRRERRVSFELPDIDSDEDVVNAMDAIANALASGELSLSEALQAASFVRQHANAVQTLERKNPSPRVVRLHTRS